MANVLVPKSGTSMAAPAIAGSLALIRQYFMNGFYPTGVRNASNAFTPSGALMKAIAIAGGVQITGSRLISDQFSETINNQRCPTVQFASINQVPGIDQGWGRLQLDSVLEFRDSTTSSPFYLYIVGGTTRSISRGQTHTYSMCVVPSNMVSSPTKIVLVWTDPPALTMSSIQLVNDLDLEVICFGYHTRPFPLIIPTKTNLILQVTYMNMTHLGNEGAYSGPAAPDRRNPVETVLLPASTMDEGLLDLSISIKANAINRGSQQNYTLVVTGLARPFTCQQIADGVSLDDKGELTPVVADKETITHNEGTASLFQGVVIGAAGFGTILVVFVISAMFRVIRSRSQS